MDAAVGVAAFTDSNLADGMPASCRSAATTAGRP
jgi:hypothetical protein